MSRSQYGHLKELRPGSPSFRWNHRSRPARRWTSGATGSSPPEREPNTTKRRREDVTVREIIARHPRAVTLDRDLLLRCIDECFDCSATCTACADACLGEPDVPEL